MLIGILSDVHEDIARLQEALKVFEDKKVEKIICLGDFVGFAAPYYSHFRTRDSNKVIELLKDKCDILLLGNHDLFAISKTPEKITEFDYLQNWYKLDYPTQKKLSDDKVWLYQEDELCSLISDSNKNYLTSLPEHLIKDYGNCKILFSHYAFPDPTGSLKWEVTEPSQLREHFEFMKQNDCLYGFSGHDHAEGIKIFTEDSVKLLPFDEKYRLPNMPAWLHIPSVANGTFKNGVVIFDTNNIEVEAISLNTPVHKKTI